MKKLNMPLFSNADDDRHCLQAALKMLLKYHFPEREYPFSYLDRLTHHHPSGTTWDTGMFLFLLSLGFELVVIDQFDLRAFANNGMSYLRRIWPEERISYESSVADLNFEWMLARDFVTKKRNVQFHIKKGTQRDIERLCNQGFIVVANVNAFILDYEEGECGHYVIITDFDKKHVCFNDSGAPAIKDRMTSWTHFTHARAGNPSLFAVRRDEPA